MPATVDSDLLLYNFFFCGDGRQGIRFRGGRVPLGHHRLYFLCYLLNELLDAILQRIHQRLLPLARVARVDAVALAAVGKTQLGKKI